MLDVETIVFSRIKAKATKKFKTKYPDISFTTSDKVVSNPKFPNVYIHLIGSPEIGNDLENNTINGIEATFQIEVTDNQNQNRAKEVMNEIVGYFKEMRFSITSMPEMNNTDSAFRCVMRCKRVIGNLDKI